MWSIFRSDILLLCCLANPFINKTSLDKVIREPVLLLFSEKDTLSLCSILACQTVNYCSAKAFSFAFRLDVLNLQQCSLTLFQICSVAAVMSCGSILSSGGQSVLLCVVGSRVFSEEDQLIPPSPPSNFLLSVFYPHFASYCEYRIFRRKFKLCTTRIRFFFVQSFRQLYSRRGFRCTYDICNTSLVPVRRSLARVNTRAEKCNIGKLPVTSVILSPPHPVR